MALNQLFVINTLKIIKVVAGRHTWDTYQMKIWNFTYSNNHIILTAINRNIMKFIFQIWVYKY